MDADVQSPPVPWLETFRLMVESQGPGQSFQTALKTMLHLLVTRHGFLRPHLVLFEPETGLLRLSMADAQPRSNHSDYSPGVGVTGQVFATGQPVIVACMKNHPLFLSKLFERSEADLERLSFLSVPVLAPPGPNISLEAGPGSPLVQVAAREVIGTLNADTPFVSAEDLALRCHFLQAVAALVANGAAHIQEEALRQRYRSSLVSLPDQNFSTDQNFSLDHEPSPAAEAPLEPFVFQSKVMRHILEQAAHVAPGRLPVLLRGEPGVGKEKLARRIHASSARAPARLIVCPCQALPAAQLEAELCGYQKGAFPGAVQSRKGLFELAHESTLFLDGVEALSAFAQNALLQLIQEHQVLRLGADKTVPANVRVIASTSDSLERCVAAGQFHPDLATRLGLCALSLPPLRERREDIVPLAEHILRELSLSQGTEIKRISYPALELLTRYFWPGNIPELQHCLERAAQYCENQVIRAIDLPPSVQTAQSSATEPALSLGDAVARFEKEMLVDALIQAEGNMLKATRALKSSYRIVNYKVKKYGIDPHQFLFRKSS